MFLSHMKQLEQNAEKLKDRICYLPPLLIKHSTNLMKSLASQDCCFDLPNTQILSVR